ncbi:MAG: MBL fold metallo-hydrolase [Deltaproteobacteria bacterium]|nr:MBL fold metallo-hydrolase [Deltaproteobacteria bacterium]
MEETHLGPLWFIPGKSHGRYPHCHSLYIEGAGVLIDPSSDRKRLEDLRRSPGVNTVWLSHWHEDHLMHLDLFDDLPLWTSAADAVPISGMDHFLDAYDLSDGLRDMYRTYMESQFHFRPRTPARHLQNGDVIDLGSLTVEIIHTPGHTPGNLSFLFREPEILFLGDYDLTDFGPWYGDLFSSIEGTIQSVRRLQTIPAKMWLTSHEQGIYEHIPEDRWDRYLAVIDEREARLLDFLAHPRTLDEIGRAWIIYGKPKEPLDFWLFGERATMQKHLTRLASKGMVTKKGDTYVRV